MGHVVVGVDGSDGATSSLQWAVGVGDRRGWPVRAVLAWGYLDQHSVGLPTFNPDYGEPEAKAALAAFVAEAVGEDVGGIEQAVVNDLPARALLDQTDGAELLIVGARGLGGWRGLLMGSVSQHCLHHSEVPVAVVREDVSTRRTFGRVVVGVDGSETSAAALEWAVAEAASRGAQLEVVHTWQLVVGPSPYVAMDPEPYEDAARGVMDEVLARVDTSVLGAEVIRTVVPGSARATLIDAASEADLAVVGARGMGGFRGMLLGSVSHALARHAACPVVVIPAAASDRDRD